MKAINYALMLFETLRNYFSVNIRGGLSILYRYIYSCIQVLQPQWDNYDTFRKNKRTIAYCKWQRGQLQNTLNALFDAIENRITVTQCNILLQYGYQFDDVLPTYPPLQIWGYQFDDTITPPAYQLFAGRFDDVIYNNPILIGVPDDSFYNDIRNTCNQIVISGIKYKIYNQATSAVVDGN